MKRRISVLAALLLSVLLCQSSAAETAGGKVKSGETSKDLQHRLMNKVEFAKTPARKPGKFLKTGLLFRSGMVLQRDRAIQVTGNAAPNSEVKLEFAGQQHQARSDASGAWKIELKPLQASNQPREMQIVSGGEKIVLTDVLVGDVWLLSGQSNMVCSANLKLSEYKSRTSFYKDKAPALAAKMEKISEWNEPEIRYYSLSYGTWRKCVGKDAKGCSLVGMYFARKLHQKLKIPIGLVTTAYGCASIETFMPLEALEEGGFTDRVKEGRAYQEILKNGGFAKLDPAERQKVLLVHCNDPHYRFCRQYGKTGKVEEKNYRMVEWHMSVVKPGAAFYSTVVKVLDYPMRGMVWYQGETNVGFKGYEVKQRLLVEYMRKLTRNPDMPFYAVMVAPLFTNPDFWVQQYIATADTAGTALANTADTPPEEQRDYHPSTKDFIGERLALAALNKTYGMTNIVYSGPVFAGAEVSGSSLLVSFRHGKGLRTTDGKAPLCFEIAGEDKKFVPATAAIEGDKIKLSAPNVPSPRYARYAWANRNNGLNVVNGAGQAMFPFDSSNAFFQSGKLKQFHE